MSISSQNFKLFSHRFQQLSVVAHEMSSGNTASIAVRFDRAETGLSLISSGVWRAFAMTVNSVSAVGESAQSPNRCGSPAFHSTMLPQSPRVVFIQELDRFCLWRERYNLCAGRS